MFERVHFRHCLGAHAEPDRATLHIDNWMVPIFSCRGSGQTDDIFCFHLLHHLLKRKRRYVVAFIDDDLTVFSNKVLYGFFLIEALNHRDIDAPCPAHVSAADMPNRDCGHFQEHRQPFLPLI